MIFFKGWQFKTQSFKTTNPPRLTLGWSHWRLTLQTGQQFATLLQLQTFFSAGTTNALMKLWQFNIEQFFRRHWVFSQINIFLAIGALVFLPFPFWMSFSKGIDRTNHPLKHPFLHVLGIFGCIRRISDCVTLEIHWPLHFTSSEWKKMPPIYPREGTQSPGHRKEEFLWGDLVTGVQTSAHDETLLRKQERKVREGPLSSLLCFARRATEESWFKTWSI